MATVISTRELASLTCEIASGKFDRIYSVVSERIVKKWFAL